MISIEGLGRSYGPREALTGASATLPGGRLTALIGPNGAGKSTLLMLLARLAEPTSGRILLEGQDISTIPTADYARRVGTLRQAPGIDLRLTLEELVGFGRFPHSRGRMTPYDREAVNRAIAFLALDDLRDTRIDQLSGGQRQLAFLAMTIAQETPVLLLDEPLNNLDIHHAVQIMRALRQLCDDQGRTVVLVIHDINFAAAHADHILALRAGRIHSAGPVDQVVTEPNLADLFGLRCTILPRPRGLVCDYFTSGDTE